MSKFIIIGENIHTTRIVKRSGRKAHVFKDGLEAVKYFVDGEERYLKVPEHFTKTQPYQLGNLKHFMIAVWKGLNGNLSESQEGVDYITYEIKRQEKFGADYLDLNVDEVSHRLNEQKSSMKWLVEIVQEISNKPLSIDSSNPEIIEVGLSSYKGLQGKVMLNSLALERPETLSLVLDYDARVIVSAASESGMPNSSDERVKNVINLVDMCLKKGIKIEDIFIDPLIFPISVNSNYVKHVFDAIEDIREIFGDKINITGGISNVSFGLPKRKMINQIFVKLGIDKGLNSGIIDPTQLILREINSIDMNTKQSKLVQNLLLGEDEYAMEYISAYRSGDL